MIFTLKRPARYWSGLHVSDMLPPRTRHDYRLFNHETHRFASCDRFGNIRGSWWSVTGNLRGLLATGWIIVKPIGLMLPEGL